MSTPTITRRVAWARLVVAMAEGLPDPNEIRFHPDRESIHMLLDTAEALTAWAKHLGLPENGFNSPMLDGDTWIHSTSNVSNPAGWYGWYLSLTAYVKATPEAAPVDEDLSAVRALADEDVTQGEGKVGASAGVVGAPTAPEGVAGPAVGTGSAASLDWTPPRLIVPAPITDRALAEDMCPGMPLPVGDTVPRCGLFAAHEPHRLGETVTFRNYGGAE